MPVGATYNDGTARYYTRSSPFSHNAPYTMSCWVRREAGLTDYHHYMHVGGAFAYDENSDFVGLDADGVTLRAGCAGGASYSFPTAGTLTAGQWYLVQMVRESTTSLKIYLDGTLSMTLTNDVTARAASTTIALTNYNSFPCRGDVAAVKAWAFQLTTAELAAEGLQYLPVTAGAWGVWPIADGPHDYSGNRRHLTTVGTLVYAAGPPIPWGPVLADYSTFPKVPIRNQYVQGRA